MTATDSNEERLPEICPHCKKRRLWSRIEQEDGMCGNCVDLAIEHANERREWDYYHPS